MRPDAKQILEAVRSLSNFLKFFPSDERVREVIMHELARMVPTQEDLNWLVEIYIRQIGEWYSLKELRAVLCVHCTPFDGIVVSSTLPGFTPAEIDRRVPSTTETLAMLSGMKQLSAPSSEETEEQTRQANLELAERIHQRAKRYSDAYNDFQRLHEPKRSEPA
jgi:hypothetical protein